MCKCGCGRGCSTKPTTGCGYGRSFIAPNKITEHVDGVQVNIILTYNLFVFFFVKKNMQFLAQVL